MGHLGKGSWPQDMNHCVKCRGMVNFTPPKHYRNGKCWGVKAGLSTVKKTEILPPPNQTNLFPLLNVLSCIA